MSRKALESLESQLVEAQRELELSTFLNKGVLQSNSEFKLRIAELEQENAILRAAESRLAKTEDKVEVAERRVKALQKELGDKDAEFAAILRADKEAMGEMEREVQGLREELRGWREVGERVGGLMLVRNGRAEGGKGEKRNAVAGSSKPPGSQSNRPSQADRDTHSSAKRGQPSTTPRQPIASPSILPQSGRLQKRKRRIEDSAELSAEDEEEEEEEDEGDEYAPSSPVSRKTPTNPNPHPHPNPNRHAPRPSGTAGRPTRNAINTSTGTNSGITHKKRDPQPPGRRSDTKRTPPPPQSSRRAVTLLPPVKLEYSSPRAPSEVESDDGE